MYKRYEKKTRIMLCIKQSRKRQRDEVTGSSSVQKTNRYDMQTQKMAEIGKICDKLVGKHGEKYTKEQTRAWAVLIQMGKHRCYQSPPDKHFSQWERGRWMMWEYPLVRNFIRGLNALTS